MRHIVTACILLLGAAGAQPQPLGAQTPDGLLALTEYIDQECDFSRSQWCRVETANQFTDVMWREDIPGREGCCHDPRNVFTDFNGMAFDGRSLYFHGGGHASYAGNEVYALDLGSLRWRRLNDPDPLTNTDFIGDDCPVPEDNIYSGHTYGNPIVANGTLHVWSQAPKCDDHGTGGPAVYGAFDLQGNEWAPRQRVPHGRSAAAIPMKGKRALVFGRGRGARVHVYDLETGERVNTGGASPRGWFAHGAATTDGDWGYLLENKSIFAVSLSLVTQVEKITDRPDALGGNAGIAYHPETDQLVAWAGDRKVFGYGLQSGEWYVYADNGSAPESMRNIFSKWRYIPPLDVFIGVGDANNVWLFRLGEAVDPRAQLGEYECSDLVPGAECPSLQQALSQGDTVKLEKGVYRQCAVIQQPTTVIGNGARIEHAVCQGKAAFVTNADATLRDLTCAEHRIGSGNGACVRQQRGELTLDGVAIVGSQNGVLAGPDAGSLTVRNSELRGLGGDCSVKCGRAHGLYYGGSGDLVISNSRLSEPKDQGHLVKTGARRTLIEDSTMDERGGNGSRMIDAYNGGELVVRNSTLNAAQGDGNPDVIGYDYEARIEHSENRVVILGGRINCASGPLLAGRNSLDRAEVRVDSQTSNCR
ncbi:MAG: hypothetical protein FKY71_11030 [Spiribacter salinus]|uniref:Uncharacterized protein n=1 Tax=Spiribacter salinus TaxID=1335746 RepID=A0A540VQN3_9GAMM|nr:MAG: hypothetical protein FKY71_11030 [Spiribacter salinus]